MNVSEKVSFPGYTSFLSEIPDVALQFRYFPSVLGVTPDCGGKSRREHSAKTTCYSHTVIQTFGNTLQY
jgi:hypothetical protein